MVKHNGSYHSGVSEPGPSKRPVKALGRGGLGGLRGRSDQVGVLRLKKTSKSNKTNQMCKLGSWGGARLGDYLSLGGVGRGDSVVRSTEKTVLPDLKIWPIERNRNM